MTVFLTRSHHANNIKNINIRDVVRYGGVDMGVKIDCLSTP